jgi:hypothetical protein
MSDPRDPKAARPYAFERLTDDEWEELTFLLAHRENSAVVRLRAPDGGLDTILPSKDRPGKAERGWQAKHYPGEIHWGRCKESLDRAVEIWEPRRVTFVFPKDLSKDEHQAFVRHLAERHQEVTVDYLAKAKISADLDADGHGARIARRFFKADDPLEVMERALRAGGELSRGEHALDREFAIGDFVQGADPHFHWVIHKGLLGEPEPPRSPGAAMRLLFAKGDQRLIADAIPRSESSLQYGPRVTVIPDDTPEGREAKRLLGDLLEGGGRLELTEGVKIGMDRLPKPFGDLVQGPLEGQFTVSAVPEARPWYMQISAETDLGPGSLDLDLGPIDPAAGWDSEWTGSQGGLELTLRTRWLVKEARGETHIAFRFRPAGVPLRDMQQAIGTMVALHGSGVVRFVDRTGDRYPMEKQVSRQPVQSQLLDLKKLADALVTLEEAAGKPMPAIPAELSLAIIDRLSEIAELLRAGGEIGRITDSHAEMSSKGVSAFKQSGSDLEVRENVMVKVFDEEFSIATRIIKLPMMRVAHAERIPGKEDLWRVKLEPLYTDEVETWIAYEPLNPVGS